MADGVDVVTTALLADEQAAIAQVINPVQSAVASCTVLVNGQVASATGTFSSHFAAFSAAVAEYGVST